MELLLILRFDFLPVLLEVYTLIQELKKTSFPNYKLII